MPLCSSLGDRVRPCLKIVFFFKLHFRFWGTCEEHARLLYGYIHGSVICCLPPHHLYLVFLPMLSVPDSSPLLSLPYLPPTDPSVWCCPPCVNVFSLFNTHLWMRRCSVWFSVLVSVCWEWWFPGSSVSLQRTRTHRFLRLHSILWCIYAKIFPVHSIMDGNLDWFQVFAIVNSAAINIHMHVSL